MVTRIGPTSGAPPQALPELSPTQEWAAEGLRSAPALSSVIDAVESGDQERLTRLLTSPQSLASYARLGRGGERALLRQLGRPLTVLNARSVIGETQGRLEVTEPTADPNRAPVFLIHGLGSSPAELSRLAYAAYQSGAEPYFVLYDDRRTSPLQMGRLLAEQIRDRFPNARHQSARVIGHSQGGLVARHAITELQHSAGDPFFGDLRFDELHTPGGYDVPFTRTFDSPFLEFITRLFHGVAAALGWRAVKAWHPENGEVRDSLHDWPNVRFFRHEPETSGEFVLSDRTFSTILDLDSEEMRDVIRFVLTDEAPAHDPRLANYLDALARDERFDEFRDYLRDRNGEIGVAQFRALYQASFPPIRGNHIDLVLGDDVVERLFSDSTERPVA
ncbi:MAG: hypothetical protein AAF654_00250 [Myxococcota bacterium]